ncbi:phthalate transporter [Jaminaea rosea]|uniref:Phthalate transporter n=1 Tax=Jaminaea rosea TaxID=1569628 RepID=A0A316UU00_9BASI|nr:phthalate transporter [Jaminaea rosea]PWN28474.1 phthalate transporter [Jaminaea rosea]
MQHASHIDSRGSQDIKYEHGDHLTGTLSPNSVESNVLAVHPDEGFDESEIKSIRRKIDWRLVPPLAALYAMSLIDRTNISLAAQAGMSRQLRLTIEDRYAHAVLAFFPPYIAFELLSNIGLRKVGARFWLPSAGVLWGISMLGMGFVNNHQGLIALRALVGLFEAALFPGATFLLGCWYLRRELAFRLTAFYQVGVFASGIAAILAYGFSLVRTGTIAGWRWIFIGEALITIALAVPGYFLIVDFPSSHRCTFLNEREKEIVATRLQRDRADAVPDSLTWGKLGKYVIDLKLWGYALCFGCTTLASYALSYFAPRIIASLGIATAVRDIYALVIPPYVAALPWGLLMAKISDKTGSRLPIIMFNACLALLGCGLFAFLPATKGAGRYVGLFICAAAANSNVPLISAASQSNIRRQSKRLYTSAIVVGFGGLGGIVSSLVFPERDAPLYRFGMIFVMGAQALVFVISGMMAIYFMAANRAAARGTRIIEDQPGYRYQV